MAALATAVMAEQQSAQFTRWAGFELVQGNAGRWAENVRSAKSYPKYLIAAVLLDLVQLMDGAIMVWKKNISVDCTVIYFFVSVAALSVCFYAIYLSRSKIRKSLKNSLARGVFEVDGSLVSGTNLRLVKTQNKMLRHPGNAPSETFCYCVGPGPSYYLAIAQIKRA